MLKFVVILALATTSLASESSANKEDEEVKVLNLSNQEITNLKDYDFNKYPLLESLDLSNNDIHHIPPEILSNNLHLKKLNLSGNKNLELSKYVSLLVASVEELNLSNCNIRKLPYSIFDGLEHLKVIDLSSNPLDDEEALKDGTLMNLVELQKVILPHVDELLIKEICKRNDITLQVHNEDNTDHVYCTDQRNPGNKDDAENPSPDTPKEDDEHQVKSTETDYLKEVPQEGETHTENENILSDKINTNDEILPENTNKDNRKRQALSDEVNEELLIDEATTNTENSALNESSVNGADENQTTDTENNDNIPKEDDETHQDNTNNNEAETKITENYNMPANGEDLQPDETEVSTENVEINNNISTTDVTTDTETPNLKSTVQNTDEDIPKEVPSENENTNNEYAEPSTDTEVPINQIKDQHSTTAESVQIPDNQSILPDTIDGNLKQTHLENENEHPLPSNNENINEDKRPLPPPPMQRGILINTETDKIISETDKINKENQRALSEQKTANNDDSNDVTKSAPSTESNTGTNVLVFLVVGVIIAGAAAFGYKFYKSRSYQAARTTEPVERELKEIVIDKKANGPSANEKIVEEEPLMQKLRNSIEIQEVNEMTQSQIQKDVKENIEMPQSLTTELTSSNPNRSGPYMPTTTTVKPSTENKDDTTQK